MLTVLEDGGMVEIATIGREGMVGVSAVLDGTPVTSAAMVQGETETCCERLADREATLSLRVVGSIPTRLTSPQRIANYIHDGIR
jgi:hypothetical protein